MVRIDSRYVVATARGEMFVRNLAMCFDRHLRSERAGETQKVFSRTV